MSPCSASRRSAASAAFSTSATRISPEGWKLVPVPPAEAAAKIAPVPLLIVHGDQDPYFPPEHARQLYLAAGEPKELWLIPGMGHAEVACGNDLVDRIARWLDHALRDPAPPLNAAAPDAAARPAAPDRNGRAATSHREPHPSTSERVPT